MKKGPLSKKEKAHVESNYKEQTAEQIAEDLDRSVEIVEKHIMKMSFDKAEPVADLEPVAEESKPEPVAEESKPEPPRTASLFARKEDRGVVVMTKEASMASDDTKSKRKVDGTTSKRMSRFIHQIKE